MRNGVNGVTKDLEESLRWAETMDGKVDMRDYYHSFILEYQKLKRFGDAIRWCEKGVRDGVAVCAVDLGIAYLYDDRGVAEDDAKALQLFNMAANSGDEYGYYNAGRCYYNGWGCTKDYHEAFHCFEEAARKNHPTAKWYLAICYFWGRGVEQSYDMAVRMINTLIRERQDYPKELMGYCYLYGKGINADPARGKQLLEESAQTGNGQAWMFLGDMYDQAIGVPEDINMAVSCYQKAAEKKIAGASEALGRYKKTLFGKWKRR